MTVVIRVVALTRCDCTHLSPGHDPVEGLPVLHEVGERREEPAVADLALVYVEPVGRAHEHLRTAAQALTLADFLQVHSTIVSTYYKLSTRC